MARFDVVHFAVHKMGKFEIVSWKVDEEVADELVVSGMAVLEQMRRQSNRSAPVGNGGIAAMSGVGMSAGC